MVVWSTTVGNFLEQAPLEQTPSARALRHIHIAKVFSILGRDFPIGFELLQQARNILSEKERRLFDLLNNPSNAFAKDLGSRKEFRTAIQKFAQTLFSALEHPERTDTRAEFSPHIKTALAHLLAIIPEALNPRKDTKNGIKKSRLHNSITTEKDQWALCDAAEARMTDAIGTGAGILANDNLFIKFEGKTVALCTKTFRSASGQIFLKGVFYAPKTKMYPGIARSFNKGRHTMTVDGGEWVLMRGASNYPITERLLANIENLKEGRHNETIVTLITPEEKTVYAQ